MGAIAIPLASGLIGLPIRTAFVILDAAAPAGVRSISNTLGFTIAK